MSPHVAKCPLGVKINPGYELSSLGERQITNIFFLKKKLSENDKCMLNQKWGDMICYWEASSGWVGSSISKKVIFYLKPECLVRKSPSRKNLKEESFG